MSNRAGVGGRASQGDSASRADVLHAGGRPRRAGFTLTELMAIVAVLGLLITLLMPALQAARETARRASCASHLARIGSGFHNYHDVHGTFPPAYVNVGAEVRWGWGTLLLPFVGQQELYERLAPARRWGQVPSPTNGMQEPISGYRCPSDPFSGHINPYFRRGEHLQGASNYVVNESVAGYEPGRHEAHTLAEITDGTAYTMLVGERDTYLRVGAAWPGRARSAAAVTFRVVWQINLRDYEGRDGWNNCRRYALASAHPGGVNAVFCDGEVRFLNEEIDAAHGGNCGESVRDPVHKHYPTNDRVYQKLFNRQDGLALAGVWNPER